MSEGKRSREENPSERDGGEQRPADCAAAQQGAPDN